MSAGAFSTVLSIEDFFDNATTVDVSSLSRDESFCHICAESFTDALEASTLAPSNQLQHLDMLDALPFAHARYIALDTPLRLPCGHIMGSLCLRLWAEEHGNTCPLCRTQLWDTTTAVSPFQEFLREYSSIDDMPIRELLVAPLSTEAQIRLDFDTVRNMRRFLFEIMIRITLRMYGLDDGHKTLYCHDDLLAYPEEKFLSSIQEIWLYNFSWRTEDHYLAKKPLNSSAMAEAYGEVCSRLGGLLFELDDDMVSARDLYNALDKPFHDIFTTIDQERILKMGIQATVSFHDKWYMAFSASG